MIIGELVEVLINIKDKNNDLLPSEYYALEEACNLLDKISRLNEADTLEEKLKKLEKKVFTAELYGDDWNGQTVSNLLCLGDVIDVLNDDE